jgi:hypothetical protein
LLDDENAIYLWFAKDGMKDETEAKSGYEHVTMSMAAHLTVCHLFHACVAHGDFAVHMQTHESTWHNKAHATSYGGHLRVMFAHVEMNKFGIANLALP